MRMRRALVALLFFAAILSSEGGPRRRRVAIPDDLDDVPDDDDEESLKEWGLKRRGYGYGYEDDTLPPPPPDFANMDPRRIQEELRKQQHAGPSYGFVKLRFGVPRSKEDVQSIAIKWSKMLKTGSIDARIMPVDLSTFMFTIEKGQHLEELKEFILSQNDAYEVKIGDQTYRRPGDPPLDHVVERLLKEKHTADRTHGNEL